MAIALLAGLILAAAKPATPTEAAPAAVLTCLTIERGWAGNRDDRRRISAVPVPDSLKEIWLGGGCEAWQLDRASLLEWHLKFGTPESTAAALEWVETTTLAHMEATDVFLRNAEKDLKGAHKGATGAAERTNRDVEAFGAYTLVAGQYLRAAEYFHSPELLAKSRPYVEAISLGLDLFEPDSTVGLATGNQSSAWIVGLDSSEINEQREFSVRYAIEEAYETGSADDVAAARKQLDEAPGGSRMLDVAAYQAIRADGDPCGGTGNAPDIAAALAKACDTESDFAGRVRRYSRDRALIGIVVARTDASEDTFGEIDTATTLLKLNQPSTNGSYPPGRSYYTPEGDEIVELFLAAADAGLACGRKHPGDNQPPCQQGAGGYLNAAEALVSPVANPNRFRQISTAYSQVCQLPVSYACDGRQEAFLRFVAAHIDEIDNSDTTDLQRPAD